MELSQADKSALLAIARASIATAFSDTKPKRSAKEGSLGINVGAFVTLKKNGELRGCIGRMDAYAPLGDVVEDMARAAAFEDPRFPSLDASELAAVKIEISVLTPMRAVGGPEDVIVGKHGVHLRLGGRSGVFLPQVPVEWNWDRDTYLKQLCRKAGLSERALADPASVLSVFEAIVFGEED